jgi:hypothetical protein
MAEPKFTIQEEITREYRRFNAVESQLTVRLSRLVDSNPMSHSIASVSDLFEQALRK